LVLLDFVDLSRKQFFMNGKGDTTDGNHFFFGVQGLVLCCQSPLFVVPFLFHTWSRQGSITEIVSTVSNKKHSLFPHSAGSAMLFLNFQSI
jgi:hypothetical protein